jgi:hypothetical protein
MMESISHSSRSNNKKFSPHLNPPLKRERGEGGSIPKSVRLAEEDKPDFESFRIAGRLFMLMATFRFVKNRCLIRILECSNLFPQRFRSKTFSPACLLPIIGSLSLYHGKKDAYISEKMIDNFFVVC